MSSLATQFCPPFFWLGELGCPPPNSPDFRRWIVSIRIWGANVTVKLCWSAAGHLAWASVSIPTIKIHWEPPLEGATFLEISPNNSNRGSWMMMFLFRVTFFFPREWICWAGFWQHTHWSSSPISTVRTTESAEAAKGFGFFQKGTVQFSVFFRPPFGLQFSLFFCAVSLFFSLKTDLKNCLAVYPSPIWHSRFLELIIHVGGIRFKRLDFLESFHLDWRLNGGKPHGKHQLIKGEKTKDQLISSSS